jgi:hypothetical protein
MAVNLSPVGGVAAQFFDNNGVILTGGKIFTYTAGTTTPQATYTSSNGGTAHSNPIILDASGRVPSGEIWLTDGLSYKFLIKDANDVLIGTYDNVIGINSNFINYTGEQEIQTATANQTVFTLTTMQYQPGTNSLSVFVDGVNQYGPGAQYAYVETSSTVITFVNGLHVGASVKFTTATINASSYGDAFQISYTAPYVDSVATSVGDKLADTVSVKDFGAIGDGVADDSVAFQAAYDAVIDRGVIYVPNGLYNVVTAPTGSKNVLWSSFGAFQPDGINPLNLNNPVLSFRNPGYIQIANTKGKAQNFAELNVERTTDYTGGTPAYVNSTIRSYTIANAGTTSYEWSLLANLQNYATQADNSENVAAYFQATKYSSGKTIASVTELFDNNAGPATTSVVQEVDLRCVGTDSNENRVVTQFLATSIDGNPASVSKGLWMTTDANTTIGNAIQLNTASNFVNYFSANSLNIRADGSTSIGTGGTALWADSVVSVAKSTAGSDSRDLYRGTTDSVLQFRVQQNGDVKNATGSYGTISDIRLKKDIVPATPKLDDLNKVNIVNYVLKDDKNNVKQLGVIADELETVFPSMVDIDSEGYKGVKTSVFIPILIKAVQELSAQVEQLKSQIASNG